MFYRFWFSSPLAGRNFTQTNPKEVLDEQNQWFRSPLVTRLQYKLRNPQYSIDYDQSVKYNG